MLWKANSEIREAMATAALARRQAEHSRRPLANLDWLLARLEEMNLAGERVFPDSFRPLLESISGLLPESVRAPAWGVTIREVMDQCFGLQDELLLPRPVRRRVLQ